MSIGFNGATCGLDIKKLISLAKLICADCDIDCINIADYSQNEVISVYRCTDVRPEEEKPESH